MTHIFGTLDYISEDFVSFPVDQLSFSIDRLRRTIRVIRKREGTGGIMRGGQTIDADCLIVARRSNSNKLAKPFYVTSASANTSAKEKETTKQNTESNLYLFPLPFFFEPSLHFSILLFLSSSGVLFFRVCHQRRRVRVFSFSRCQLL